jgi:hypothetical protein
MKHPYDQIMLALFYMWGNATIQNWVKHEMCRIDAMISITNWNPVPYESKQLWMEFQMDFDDMFTNMTKVQDVEAALEHIHIQHRVNWLIYLTFWGLNAEGRLGQIRLRHDQYV